MCADQRRPGTALVQPVNDSDPYGITPPAPTPARSEVTPEFIGTDANGNRFGFTSLTNPGGLLMWEQSPGKWQNDWTPGYPSPTLRVFLDLARQGAFAAADEGR